MSSQGLILLMTLVALANLGYADIPRLINYQGRLTDSRGTPVPNGNYTITFRIYNVGSGGTALWTETQSVTTTDGLFSVHLGSVTPLNLDFNQNYWLGIQVAGDSEMTPRQRIVAAGYAINADTLDGRDGTYYTNWNNLTNVPGGFADGIDNTGGITDDSVLSRHIVNETIVDADISPGANITASKINRAGLNADLLDGKDSTVFATATHTHDDRYYTEAELNTGDGTINQDADPVHWTKLKGVPDGFADGIDHTGVITPNSVKVNISSMGQSWLKT